MLCAEKDAVGAPDVSPMLSSVNVMVLTHEEWLAAAGPSLEVSQLPITIPIRTIVAIATSNITTTASKHNGEVALQTWRINKVINFNF